MGGRRAGGVRCQVCAIAVFRSRAALAGALFAAVIAGGPRAVPFFAPSEVGANEAGAVDGVTVDRSLNEGAAVHLTLIVQAALRELVERDALVDIGD